MKKGLILGGILLPCLIHAQRTDSTRSRFVTTAPRLGGGVTVTSLVTPIKTGGKVSLLASYSFSRTTNLTLIGLATIASDFKQNIVADDIGVTFTYIHNYSGDFFLPLPDIDWMISKKWNLAGVLPARLSLKYKFVPSQSIGITAWSLGSMYRLNEGTEKQYLHLQQYSVGILYELNMGRWKLTLTGGHTLLQRLETFDMDQKVPSNAFKKLYDQQPDIFPQAELFCCPGRDQLSVLSGGSTGPVAGHLKHLYDRSIQNKYCLRGPGDTDTAGARDAPAPS